jgi:hypothetical protein
MPTTQPRLMAQQQKIDIRTLGRLCLAAGVLGAASGIFLAVVPAQVQVERFSYPLDAAAFVGIQLWFAIQHLGLIAGLVGLRRSGAMRADHRAGRVGLDAAIAGMALLTLTELAAGLAAYARIDTTIVAVLNAGYGISCVVIGVGLVMAGIEVIRAGRWRGARACLVLILGVWVFVPMTPAMSAGFVPARLGITGWMVLFALLGWVLTALPAQQRIDLVEPAIPQHRR